ncbi:MAG: glycosyltransferase family 2 protein [Planctomycetota bacterium]|jgi:dolichol-phosphate mannosyltransferase
MARITIVIPVYNEQDCLEPLFERLWAMVRSQPEEYQLLFVDDGSTDGSLEIIRRLAASHTGVGYLSLSRNFGHEMATTAGLDHAAGDAVVILDADLQDPPEVIPELVAKWQEGYEVVYARRRVRKGEGPAKRATSWLFYRTISALTDVPIPADTGDFRLMDRRVAEVLGRCREQKRFVRGLVSWAGFRQTAVEYERDARAGGATKYGPLKLVRLAFDAVSGFSDAPLRVGIMLGLGVCVLSLILASVVFVQKLFWGIDIPGYALMATGLFFLGGVQLLVAGIVGLYIGQIYAQVQQRPLYVVQERTGQAGAEESRSPPSGRQAGP